jgi:hypothetical protein
VAGGAQSEQRGDDESEWRLIHEIHVGFPLLGMC